MKVLFPGRFQPLHKGHEKVIRNLLRKGYIIIVAIGSINQPRSFQNPFTFKERKLMFKAVFPDEIKRGRIKLVGIEDYFDDKKWTDELIKKAEFDVVVTGNSWTARCFSSLKPVIRLKLYKRKFYQAKKIRKLMLAGNVKWKKFVNPKVAKLIEEFSVKAYLEVLKKCG